MYGGLLLHIDLQLSPQHICMLFFYADRVPVPLRHVPRKHTNVLDHEPFLGHFDGWLHLRMVGVGAVGSVFCKVGALLFTA